VETVVARGSEPIVSQTARVSDRDTFMGIQNPHAPTPTVQAIHIDAEQVPLVPDRPIPHHTGRTAEVRCPCQVLTVCIWILRTASELTFPIYAPRFETGRSVGGSST
jgi:hypothetical protein